MSYFIKIDDATDLRRKILESSKGSIHVLRGYQHLVLIRNKKLTLLRTLRRELKELTLLVNRAERLMPKLSKTEVANINAGKKPRKSAKSGSDVYLGHKEIHVKKPAKKKEPKKQSELERLQSQLSDIEYKLKGI